MSSGRETDLERGTVTRTRKRLRPPAPCRVLLHNDDYTTMDFVIHVLETVFRRTHSEAVQIMLFVHQRGVGVAGVYPREVAETKAATVEAMARENDFPLKCSVEEV